VVFDKFEASIKAFFSGRCQAYTTDASALAFIRSKEAPVPDDYLVLPEIISKEPLGPAVRRGDDEWFAIVKWTINALIEAEELRHHPGPGGQPEGLPRPGRAALSGRG
jgi:general L-amino acid transport system substrate-binding protein